MDIRDFSMKELEELEDRKDAVLSQYGERSRAKKEVLKRAKNQTVG